MKFTEICITNGSVEAARLLSLKSNPLMTAVTEWFGGRSSAAAQPGFRSLEDHLMGGISDGDLPLEMQRSIRRRNHTQLSAGGHFFAGVGSGHDGAGIVECHGKVAVVTEGFVLRGPAAAKSRPGIGKQFFVVLCHHNETSPQIQWSVGRNGQRVRRVSALRQTWIDCLIMESAGGAVFDNGGDRPGFSIVGRDPGLALRIKNLGRSVHALFRVDAALSVV